MRAAGTNQIRGILQPAGVDIRGLRALPGAPNKITFEAPADVTVGAAPIALTATASSGLPVSFFVVAGPAIVRDGKVELTAIPPRTAFPVSVTIGAWQFGRRTEPAVKIADVVQKSFKILR